MALLIKLNRDVSLPAGHYLMVGPGNQLRVFAPESLPANLNEVIAEPAPPPVIPESQPLPRLKETRKPPGFIPRPPLRTPEEARALDDLIVLAINEGASTPLDIARALGFRPSREAGSDYQWLSARLRDSVAQMPSIERVNVGRGAIRATWRYYPKKGQTS